MTEDLTIDGTVIPAAEIDIARWMVDEADQHARHDHATRRDLMLTALAMTEATMRGDRDAHDRLRADTAPGQLLSPMFGILVTALRTHPDPGGVLALVRGAALDADSDV